MTRWWLRLAVYARPQWRGLSVLLLIALARVGLEALRPWPVKLIVDSVAGDEPMPAGAGWLMLGATESIEVLAVLTASTILLFIAVWVLRIAETYTLSGTSNRMVYGLASDIFDRMQRLSLRFHGRKPTGDLVKRVTADTKCVRELIIDSALPVLTSLVSLGVMFTIMWRLDAALSLVAIVAAPLLGFAIIRSARPMEKLTYEQYERQGEVMALAEQTLTALPIVRAFGREDYEDTRFREFCRRSDQAYLRAIAIQLKFKLSVETVTAVGSSAVLALGGFHVLNGQISVGTLLVFVGYLSSLYAPIETLAYVSASFAAAAAGARRVFGILDSRDEMAEMPGARNVSHVAGHIRFQNVTAAYEADRPVLREINFEASPGEMIAIVGPTGAGKTTLVSLIPRLLDPCTGQVLLDGTPLTEIKLRSLRSQIAVVLQDAFLLPLTVAENIAYGRPGASREEIVAAAVAAQADGFIRRLPAGFDTVLGERGATLSGGERQRISIARAFLKDSPVLILDEPTASLDAETELTVMTALDRLMNGRTTFVIAHRMSTVRRAHRLLVLDQGRIVECGKHDELLRNGSLYARLHAHQFHSADALQKVG